MATEFIATAEHTVTCPVCLEFFVDPHIPKDLECPHACCQVCLQRIAILNEPGQLITCPLCKRETPIPEGGIAAMKTNLQLKNLADKHPHYTKGPRRTVPKCAHHDDEKMHLYCKPCNKLVCQNCIFAFHQGAPHEIKDVKVTSQAWKQELDRVVTNTNKEALECRQAAQKIKDLQTIKWEKTEFEKQQVDQFAEKVIAEVIKVRDGLKTELQNIAELELAKMHQEIVHLEEHAKQLETANKVAKETCASSDYAYIMQHASLVDKMKMLTTCTREKAAYINQTSPAAKFVPRKDVPDVKLGRVTKLKNLKLVQEITGFNWAYRLACSLDGSLVVSDYNAKEVIVHQKQNGKYKKHFSLSLHLQNSQKPRGVAICPDDKFLVARGNGIEMYSSEGEYQKPFEDETMGTNVWSVVTMADGRILAGDVGRCVITKHEPTGNIIQTIKTNIKPIHMTLIHDTHIAISDRESSKVSVIDMTSQQETLSIDIPRVEGICYDEQTECLLTVRSEPADKPSHVLPNTGVIEQYCCTTGRLVACLAQGLCYPTGMVLIPDGNLAVADRKSVKIYSIF